MSVEVKIPAVGESISSGVVSVWHKKSGEFVREGEALFTLETDKVSTEIVAEAAGVLEALVKEGDEVKIGQVVARIDTSKTESTGGKAATTKAPAPAGEKEKKSNARAAVAPLSPAVRRVVEEKHLDPAQLHGTGKGGRLTKA